jgi:hypothetical protein
MCFTLRLHMSAAPPQGGLTQALAPMKKVVIAIALLLATLPGQSLACTPLRPSEAIGRDAERVLIGVTTSRSRMSERPFEALVDIKIVEVVKGHAVKAITAVSPCALPLKRGEKVVAVSVNKRWIAYPFDMYEKPIRAGVQDGR